MNALIRRTYFNHAYLLLFSGNQNQDPNAGGQKRPNPNLGGPAAKIPATNRLFTYCSAVTFLNGDISIEFCFYFLDFF